VALALQADGWYLRSDIIWHKPNPKPEGGLKNRPTKGHEYLFLLSRRPEYHYDIDAIREPVTSSGGACIGKQRHSTTGTGAESRRLQSASKRNYDAPASLFDRYNNANHFFKRDSVERLDKNK
jgi:hypothetical protein